MAVLRCLLTLLLLSAGTPVQAHMGRTIYLLYPEGADESLAANIVAAYMGEQMGREILAEGRKGTASCLDGVIARESPMALVPADGWESGPSGLVKMDPAIRVGTSRYVLIMGQEAAGQLQFSLVRQYLSVLSAGLDGKDLDRSIDLVRRGSGARKVALDLLREGDML